MNKTKTLVWKAFDFGHDVGNDNYTLLCFLSHKGSAFAGTIIFNFFRAYIVEGKK